MPAAFLGLWALLAAAGVLGLPALLISSPSQCCQQLQQHNTCR
jgi:hypothetical protein